MKTICLGIAIILFSIVFMMSSSGLDEIGWVFALIGLIISLTGYFKDNAK